MKYGLSLALLTALVLLTGCDSSPKRYTISGSVKFGGNPVKAGEVSFEPDTSKGNSGPGSVAKIKDGMYTTEQGMGVVGGAYIVRIVPMSGSATGDSLNGTALLQAPYEERVEFPAADTYKDFDIPKKGK